MNAEAPPGDGPGDPNVCRLYGRPSDGVRAFPAVRDSREPLLED
jgi:hypothetical protein